MNKPSDNLKVLGSSQFLELVERDGWSFARRPKVRVVAVVAVTDARRLILVEQFRIPVNANVIELPAGLAGDEGDPDEALVVAAERELLEETGYSASEFEEVAAVTSSAGLTDEEIVVFRARQLKKKGAGGGVAGEDIVVHEIPLDEAEEWLRGQAATGKKIDSRVFAALYWARE